MNPFCRVLPVIAVISLVCATAVAQNDDPAEQPKGPHLLSCSPAPCVLPPTQASPGPKNSNDAPIALSPSNPREILVGSNTWNCLPYESMAFYSSVNGGSTWNDTCMSAIFYNGQTYFASQGPILAYDRDGAAYIAGLYGDNNGDAAIGFEKSTDGGLSWPDNGVAIANANLPEDCWMTADTNAGSPYVNSVYVSCVMHGPPFQFTQNQVVVSHSDDGGLTWHVANVAPIQNSPEQDFYTSMVVGKDGTLYLTWEYCSVVSEGCDKNQAYMVFLKSTDGGNTWSKPNVIAKVTLTYPLPNTESVFVPDGPAIAVDASDGARSGSLYVSMYNWTGAFMQVVIAHSTDGGKTWSKPAPVAPGVTHDQFLPWIAVSPTGLVGVMWLDRRNDPNNLEYQAFAGISADGGLTFDPNIQLTLDFSNPTIGKTTIGDYNGAAWDGANYFLAAWMDESNGVNTQDLVGGIRLK